MSLGLLSLLQVAISWSVIDVLVAQNQGIEQKIKFQSAMKRYKTIITVLLKLYDAYRPMTRLL